MVRKEVRVAVGCDHRGLGLKKSIMAFLEQRRIAYQDLGCFTTDPVDYPDIAEAVGEAVASGSATYGILMCDTGIGMCIAANKVKGIRAALCHDDFSARRARQHNDANVLCLAAGRDTEHVTDIIDAFINTDFEGGRHLGRVNKIRAMEG